MAETLHVELDQLDSPILHPLARRLLVNALTCYRAGCLRQCIIATSVVVVQDLLLKLAEFERHDRTAWKSKLEQLDSRDSSQSDTSETGPFERHILDIAERVLEMVTPVEREHLEWLFTDRDRCLYHEMDGLDTPFEPHSDLARMHLGNAVKLVLQRLPGQGQAVIQRVQNELQSGDFPADHEQARQHLESLRLAYARKALVWDLFIRLMKDVLLEDRTEGERKQIYAALLAMNNIFEHLDKQLLPGVLPDLLDAIPEEGSARLIGLCRQLPSAWESGGSGMHVRLQRCVANASDLAGTRAIIDAIHVPGLHSMVEARLARLTPREVQEFIDSGEIEACTDRAVHMFCNSNSIYATEELGAKLLIPVAEAVAAKHAKQVAQAIQTNSQIFYSWRALNDILPHFYHQAQKQCQSVRDHWYEAYKRVKEQGEMGEKLCSILTKDFPEFEASMDEDGTDSESQFVLMNELKSLAPATSASSDAQT